MARRTFPMEAGERDRLVTLIPIVDGSSDSGFPIERDIRGIQFYARKDDIGGRERFTADQLSAPYDTRWELPYRVDIDPDVVDVPKAFALECQGRRFDIVAASMIGRKEGIEILALGRMG